MYMYTCPMFVYVLELSFLFGHISNEGRSKGVQPALKSWPHKFGTKICSFL